MGKAEAMMRLQYYTNLEQNVRGIISDTKNAFNNLEDAQNNIGNYYKVDGEAFDYGRIRGQREELKAIYTYLENTIIPSINQEIQNLRSIIEQLCQD